MSTQNPQTVDNGNAGILVGVEPAQPRQASDWATQTPAQAVSQPVQLVEQQPVQPSGRFFTEDDMAKARQQEKDKLYPRIEQMDAQLKELQKERDTMAKEREAAAKKLAEEQNKKEEAALEVRDLLTKREKEWEDRFAQIEQQREADRAIYDQEKRLMELDRYRQARIEQEQEYILPELRDLIRGASPEEIDASIATMRERTDAIIGNLTAVTSPPTQMPRGAAPTAPPVGPMEQMTTYQSLTPEDIRSMDIETYKKYRESLLQQASRQYRGRP